DTIITPSFWGADSVSFWCRGAGVPYKQQDTLDMCESPDSSSWTLVVDKDSLPTAGTTLTYSIQPTTNHLMFIYKRATVNGGSVAFDDVMVLSNAVGISAPQSISEINIFPTVSNGFFRIESSEKIQSIEAYTIAGEKIFSFLPSSQRSIPVDASSHPDGIYLLSLKTNSGIITKKIIISR
ncbi:MAG: T9SS type A sorting domain-containing protein, partial [Bacteroidetes bacterium]|nr:T9SS type A sorting domain-containing protein [Bacteroidota bacterium]